MRAWRHILPVDVQGIWDLDTCLSTVLWAGTRARDVHTGFTAFRLAAPKVWYIHADLSAPFFGETTLQKTPATPPICAGLFWPGATVVCAFHLAARPCAHFWCTCIFVGHSGTGWNADCLAAHTRQISPAANFLQDTIIQVPWQSSFWLFSHCTGKDQKGKCHLHESQAAYCTHTAAADRLPMGTFQELGRQVVQAEMVTDVFGNAALHDQLDVP